MQRFKGEIPSETPSENGDLKEGTIPPIQLWLETEIRFARERQQGAVDGVHQKKRMEQKV